MKNERNLNVRILSRGREHEDKENREDRCDCKDIVG